MASKLFRSLGPVYTAAVKLKGSPRWAMAKAALGRPLYRLEHRPGLDVDLAGRIGMGALLCYALRLHALAEDRGVAATIISTSPLYGTGTDFFDEYFERPQLPPGWKPHSPLATEWLLHGAAPRSLTLERAQDLFRRHFVPKACLRQKTAGTFDLSVHFRATDKVLESGHVAAERMLEALEEQLPDAGGGKRVFLATDDAGFGEAVRRRFPAASFASFDAGEVEAGVPRHFSNLPAQAKALEALVNIYLLAAAPLCVRTASYLSAMSRIVNPALATRTINSAPGAQGFPEDQIRRAEADATPEGRSAGSSHAIPNP